MFAIYNAWLESLKFAGILAQQSNPAEAKIQRKEQRNEARLYMNG